MQIRRDWVGKYLQNVKADISELVHIRMKAQSVEFNHGRLERVVSGKL